jgi:hypothetical protein
MLRWHLLQTNPTERVGCKVRHADCADIRPSALSVSHTSVSSNAPPQPARFSRRVSRCLEGSEICVSYSLQHRVIPLSHLHFFLDHSCWNSGSTSGNACPAAARHSEQATYMALLSATVILLYTCMNGDRSWCEQPMPRMTSFSWWRHG